MMDEFEIAEQSVELYLADALRRVRQAEVNFPADECMNCGANLAVTRKRFCDVECAEDWHRRAERAF